MLQSNLIRLIGLLIVAVVLHAGPVRAWTYDLDSPQVEVVGELRHEHARRSDTLMDIARWLSMGYREIRRANPEVDLWKPGEGTVVLIPALFVLPDAPREGIVVNRAEKRLYYFHPNPDGHGMQVTSYPIGIGREGRETPLGSARVTAKLDSPAWYPTDGVIADYASRGISLPRMIPPGPENPLGAHVLMLDMPGYMLHGTHRPDGVGMRVSQGCVRLYDEHIARLIETVPLGTAVHFVDQAIKLGQRDGRLYLEVHADAEGHAPELESIRVAIERWQASSAARRAFAVDMDQVAVIGSRADGVPTVIAELGAQALLEAGQLGITAH